MDLNSNNFKRVNEVYETKNLDAFKYLLGNRAINEEVVRTLQNDISENGQLTPIIVNEKWEIIDGQHRLEAMKRLNKPVRFILEKGYGIKEVRNVNAISNSWTLIDHLESRVALGYEDYIYVKNLMTKYDLRLDTVLYILAKNQTVYHSRGITNSFKRDNVIINTTKSEAKDLCKKINDFKPYVGELYHLKTFQLACLNIIKRDNYDHKKMMYKIKKYGAQLEPKTSRYRGAIKLFLNEVYNYRSRKRDNLLSDKEIMKIVKRYN